MAERAGVGLGTIYRRFAKKAALVDELARRLLRNTVAIGERHIDHPEGAGLFPICGMGDLPAPQSGIVGRMWNAPGPVTPIASSREVQSMLLRQAQEHGLVRDDAVPEDIAVICWSVSGVLDVTRRLTPTAWRRHLELCIEGLRSSVGQLREAPLTSREMDRAIFGKRRGRAPSRRAPVPSDGRLRRAMLRLNLMAETEDAEQRTDKIDITGVF